LRDLDAMAEAKLQDEWTRFSSLIARVHNVQQTKKSNLIHPDQINPFSKLNRLRNQRDIGAGRRNIGTLLSSK